MSRSESARGQKLAPSAGRPRSTVHREAYHREGMPRRRIEDPIHGARVCVCERERVCVCERVWVCGCAGVRARVMIAAARAGRAGENVIGLVPHPRQRGAPCSKPLDLDATVISYLNEHSALDRRVEGIRPSWCVGFCPPGDSPRRQHPCAPTSRSIWPAARLPLDNRNNAANDQRRTQRRAAPEPLDSTCGRV
jgi:hypothetical protein